MAKQHVSNSLRFYQPSLRKLIDQLLCAHHDEIKRVDGTRLFLECMGCGRLSNGIETGGHNFGGAR